VSLARREPTVGLSLRLRDDPIRARIRLADDPVGLLVCFPPHAIRRGLRGEAGHGIGCARLK
jgi:hypothetical protein